MAGVKQKVPDPIVVLNETYQVTLDPRCLILYKKITNEDKDKELSKEEVKNGARVLGYFSTWESVGTYLIKDMSREKIKAKKEELTSIMEYINIIKECQAKICSMFSDMDDSTKAHK